MSKNIIFIIAILISSLTYGSEDNHKMTDHDRDQIDFVLTLFDIISKMPSEESDYLKQALSKFYYYLKPIINSYEDGYLPKNNDHLNHMLMMSFLLFEQNEFFKNYFLNSIPEKTNERKIILEKIDKYGRISFLKIEGLTYEDYKKNREDSLKNKGLLNLKVKVIVHDGM